jgi:hypothetical protein
MREKGAAQSMAPRVTRVPGAPQQQVVVQGTPLSTSTASGIIRLCSLYYTVSALVAVRDSRVHALAGCRPGTRHARTLVLRRIAHCAGQTEEDT